MDVSPVDGAGPSQPRSIVSTASGGGFEAALGEVELRAAARDLLAAMPPPIAYQILHPPADGSPPVPGMHEMFVAVQDGSHVPSERELRSPFWSALDTAARTFESPDDLWATMRAILADRGAIAAAVSSPSTAPATAQADVASALAPQTPTATDPPESSEGRAALSALGGELPDWQIDWWEWVLQHILIEAGTQDQGA